MGLAEDGVHQHDRDHQRRDPGAQGHERSQQANPDRTHEDTFSVYGAVITLPPSFICRNSRHVPGAGSRTPIVSFPGAVEVPATRLEATPGSAPQLGASGAQMWVWK